VKAVFVRFGICFFACASANSGANVAGTIEALLDRYEVMAERSQVEDVWASQRRLASKNYIPLTSGALHDDNDFLMRREWYLRLGSAAVPLTLRDLKDVREAALLDELLWALLLENIENNFWAPSHPWSMLRATLSKFLSEHVLGVSLEQEKHQDWWRWVQGKRLGKNPDPRILALDKILSARSEKNSLRRVEHFFAAFDFLKTEPKGSLERLGQELWDGASSSEEEARKIFREFYNRNPQNIIAENGYVLLSEVLAKRGQGRLAAEFLAYSLMSRLARGEALSFVELKAIADQQYQDARYDQAYMYYSLAQEKSVGVRGPAFLDLEVKKQLAALYSGELKKIQADVVQDEFERLLDTAFHSVYRDSLLVGYGEFLEERADWHGARDIWSWVYQFAADSQKRLLGYARSSRATRTLLEAQSPGLNKKENLLQWLALLGVWKRRDSQSPEFRKELNEAVRIAQKLGLSREAEVQASLGELRD
jgi:hypothetical protein